MVFAIYIDLDSMKTSSEVNADLWPDSPHTHDAEVALLVSFSLATVQYYFMLILIDSLTFTTTRRNSVVGPYLSQLSTVNERLLDSRGTRRLCIRA